MSGESPSQLDLFSSPERKVSQHFIGWNAPLLELAARFLSRDWETGPLDLSRLLVVVPTRNASRRLRESLAILASDRQTGVLPPLILNPDDLLLPTNEQKPVASKAEALAAWIEVLLKADLDTYPHLFPVPPLAQNFPWALATAKDFLSVQSLLNEGAHNINFASKVLATEDLETERWQELAELERLTFSKLEKSGKSPRAAARRQAIDHWTPPPSCQKIILLGLPDPPPALQPLIERISQTTPVEVVIHAPEQEAPNFDWLGQPSENWQSRHLTIPEEHIFPCINPASQALRTCELLLTHPEPHRLAAIGISDPEVVPPLQKSLSQNNWNAFDPSGTPFSQQGASHLLRTLRDFASTQLLSTFRDLLRIPGAAEAAGSFQVPADQEPFEADRILIAFDSFHENHLCESLSDALAIINEVKQDKAPIVRSLQWMDFHLKNLARKNLSEALTGFLNDIYQHSDHSENKKFESVTQSINALLSEFDTLSLPAQSGLERFQLFLTLLDEQVIASNRPSESIDLPGWLELPWEDAPHIILSGCNDGLVPESIQGHPWLPNQARRLLGLRHNDSRQARDTYLMASLIASRQDNGRLDILFGRVNSQSDPLRPSRLLLALPPEELPPRVNFLFQEVENEVTPQPWNLAWQLTPPQPDPERFQKLSVTSFSSYLACPFRYYLQFGLRMREPDLDRMELNARDFGTLTHDVLEDFAATSAVNSESQKDINQCFEDLLADRLDRLFGKNLSAPLLIQAASIRQRLSWWAEHEARHRKEGWTILETETELAPKEKPFLLGETLISGKIDRIETHPDEGLRILDFKTKKKPKPVLEAHLRKRKRSEEDTQFPSWQIATLEGKEMLWTNLQIPLYLMALSHRAPNRNCFSGYVQLGASKGDIHLDLWESLDEDLLNSARQCALGVIENIQNLVFWPPAEKPEFDNFADLLFSDPTSAVNSVNLETPARP